MKDRQINGLGDRLYYLFKDLGVTHIVEWLYDGKGCGCSSRRAWLNKKFPTGQRSGK